MEEQQPAHLRFIQFVQAFYRQVDADLPPFDWDGTGPIAFEVLLGEVKFLVGYDPAATGGACLFVYCVFGPLPPHQDGVLLRRLLELNLPLAREHNATHCIDKESGEVACYLRMDLGEVEVPAVHAEMARIADQAERWRQGDFQDDSGHLVPAPHRGALAAWVVLA